jgi:hypothetical protein
MKYTDKTEITEIEKLQLIGLLTLAKSGNERQQDILKAVLAITGETDELGHSSDAVYSDYTADELLERLGIKVVSAKSGRHRREK